MVTFTINIPQMLAYVPYMDPMGIVEQNLSHSPQKPSNTVPSFIAFSFIPQSSHRVPTDPQPPAFNFCQVVHTTGMAREFTTHLHLHGWQRSLASTKSLADQGTGVTELFGDCWFCRFILELILSFQMVSTCFDEIVGHFWGNCPLTIPVTSDKF